MQKCYIKGTDPNGEVLYLTLAGYWMNSLLTACLFKSEEAEAWVRRWNSNQRYRDSDERITAETFKPN